MHWVDRGPEPDGLEAIRARYTPGWIRHFRDGHGSRPHDARWQAFRDDLHEVFRGLCAYCEERSNEEVDHFRPVKRFPEQVYHWSNWVLACTSCNRAKGTKWPPEGYVDPCAASKAEHPETYFTFDTLTGIMFPRKDLSAVRHAKAATMIEDLNLNGRQHILNRKQAVEGLSRMARMAVQDHPRSRSILEETFVRLSLRESPLSSIVRVWLSEQGFAPTD